MRVSFSPYITIINHPLYPAHSTPMDIPLDKLQSDVISNELIMSFLIHEEMKTDYQKETRELNKALRHCFYVRNRNVPLTPEAMDSLEFSIQEHMAKFKVEFEANDEKIHITIGRRSLGSHSSSSGTSRCFTHNKDFNLLPP
ncbi:uncharacterized protein FTJAE_13752 [Fusarium tjaetaba]|uniref:Uncharacterized protein n=1 Tax=Fusarium tjaetaba TaxID=1567544 RepID=A0A8H5QHX5_9HYPO|nr:uncharacterized protein FTJAE_13752 [Fusarium tjaetaba]KAF5614483.1 hypothetical protein FTJAE_13752 [Fusarium tjaetaba]